MEKKNQSNKKPTQADLKKLMALGNLAEKNFKKESLTKIQETESAAKAIDTLPESTNVLPVEQAIPEVLPVAIENPDPTPTAQQNEPEQQKNKEEQLVTAMDVPFEVFFKKYYPSDTDRRETVWVYTTNLKILKAISTSEDAPMIDIVNNIIAEWAKKYNKNIRKSLQKPSKMFGF